MPPSIAPAPFYGNVRPSLDLIQQLRISRLLDTRSANVSSVTKKRKSKSPHVKHRYNGVKLFPGVSHGIKKPKSKKLKLVKEKRVSEKSTAKSTLSVREKMRNKFDFSRTPYAIPARRRIALNDETSMKRKFFKSTTLETLDEKRAKLDENESILDFEDTNDVDEEPFAEINEDVANTLHQIDWSDDEECLRPQITRQKAVILENSSASPIATYLKFTSKSPSVIPTTPTSQAVSTSTNIISEVHSMTPTSQANSTLTNVLGEINCVTPTSKANSCTTPVSAKVKSARNDENISEITPTQMKYFSLFTSPAKNSATKNMLSDITNKLKKSTNSLDRAAAPSNQYQIDAGQKIIGPRECPECKMVYEVGDPFDKLRHDQHHNSRRKIKYKCTTDENIVAYCGTGRQDCIVLVKYADAKRRKKVIDVLEITEKEIGLGYSFHSTAVAYLYIQKEYIVGCLIAEPNVKASRVIESDPIVLLDEQWERVKFGVNRIWVNKDNRRQKIATELMNCLRQIFGLGLYLDLNDIAFSVPTIDGDAFAKKYTKTDKYLAYIGDSMK